MIQLYSSFFRKKLENTKNTQKKHEKKEKMVTSRLTDSMVNISCSYVYMCMCIMIFFRPKKYAKYHWNIFTRVVATLNAIQCSAITGYFLYKDWDVIWSLFYENETIVTSLYIMAGYLFVDGLFDVLFLLVTGGLFRLGSLMSLCHHFVGGRPDLTAGGCAQGLRHRSPWSGRLC